MADGTTDGLEAAESAASSDAHQSDVAPADSSAADGPESTFDALNRALAGGGDSAASETDPGEADAASEEQAPPDADGVDTQDADGLSEAEMAALRPKTRQRMELLAKARTEAIQELEETTAKHEREISEYRADAEEYRALSTFMGRHDVQAEDVADAVHILAQIKSDPRGALERLMPIVHALSEKSGATLPTDLAEDVRQGRITQTRALELSRTRADAERLTARQQAAQEADQRRQQQEAQSAQVAHAQTALKTWAEEQRAVDPDFSAKEAHLAQLMRAEVVAKGMPGSAEAVRKMADGLLKQVNDFASAYRPAPKPVKPPAASSSRATPASLPPAVDTAEALRVAFRARLASG